MELLTTGNFSEATLSSSAALSFMVDARWVKLLEESCAKHDTWLHNLHLGNLIPPSSYTYLLSSRDGQTEDGHILSSQLGPLHERVLVVAGTVALELGNLGNATMYLRRSLMLKPNVQAARSLGLIAGSIEEATDMYMQAWQIWTTIPAADPV